MKLCECGCGEPTRIAPKTSLRSGHVKGQPLRFVNGHNTRLRVGQDHPGWKGEGAGYMALHNWLRRSKKKTGRCEECGASRKTDWANVSGEYRRDLADYQELCRSCHVARDRERDPESGRFLGAPTIGEQLGAV